MVVAQEVYVRGKGCELVGRVVNGGGDNKTKQNQGKELEGDDCGWFCWGNQMKNGEEQRGVYIYIDGCMQDGDEGYGR